MRMRLGQQSRPPYRFVLQICDIMFGMKSLYRRWRPLKLDDVVGQEQVTTPLIAAIKQDKIAHAYLFTGPRGTGKTSVARIFAHQINGFEYTLEDEYTDIIEIDGASNRGIDDIREIREKALIAPTIGKFKVYIIDEVHMLTREAFNALLKTLEEPPAHVVFIMATTDAHKVPITITSRAQTYNFKLAEPEIILPYLKRICLSEKINIDDNALKIIVKRGGGSFRDSLSLLDQISTISDDVITKEQVEEIMGLPEEKKIQDLLDYYKRADVVKITTLLKEIIASGIRIEVAVEELLQRIIDEPRDEFLPLLEKLPDVKAPFAEARLIAVLAHTNQNTKSVTTSQAPTMPKTKETVSYHQPLSSAKPIQKAEDTPAMSKFEKFMAERNKSKNISADNSQKTENGGINSKISAIMGGEVQEYGGGSPF